MLYEGDGARVSVLRGIGRDKTKAFRVVTNGKKDRDEAVLEIEFHPAKLRLRKNTNTAVFFSCSVCNMTQKPPRGDLLTVVS